MKHNRKEIAIFLSKQSLVSTLAQIALRHHIPTRKLKDTFRVYPYWKKGEMKGWTVYFKNRPIYEEDLPV